MSKLTLPKSAKRKPATAVATLTPEEARLQHQVRMEHDTLTRFHRACHLDNLRVRVSGLMQFVQARAPYTGHVRIDLRDPNHIRYSVCHITRSGDLEWRASTAHGAAEALGPFFQSHFIQVQLDDNGTVQM